MFKNIVIPNNRKYIIPMQPCVQVCRCPSAVVAAQSCGCAAHLQVCACPVHATHCLYYKYNDTSQSVDVRKIVAHPTDNTDYIEDYQVDVLTGTIRCLRRRITQAYPSSHRLTTYTYE